MSEAETVLYEVRDGIATVEINRPEMRNALSPAAANRLHDLWGEVDADKNVRVAILTSADCGTFCAGLDLREASRVKKEEGVDILTKMKEALDGSRGELSAFAPRMLTIKTVSYTHLTLPTNREV